MKKRKRLKKKNIQTVRELTEPSSKLTGKKSLGKPDGSLAKDMPDHKELKRGLMFAFRDSRAMGIIKCCLDYKLPSIWRVYYEKIGVIKVDPEGHLTILDDVRFFEILSKLDKNFKWAVEQLAKIIPKDMLGGGLRDDHTLTGIVRRVTKRAKSVKTKELIEGRREEEVLEFKQTEEEEVKGYETSGTDS